MKYVFVFILGCFSQLCMSQVVDSVAHKSKQHSIEKNRTDKDVKQSEVKETFGDYVQKVGLGIWGRVKERLNVAEVVESLEEKRDKFLGGKGNNDAKKGNRPTDQNAAKEKPIDGT